ncbi:MAG TPA: hypothetical protein VFD27_18355, partial [Chthoniobacteraceae bacterium]|nr:hypothetical protein [Chthoniobacteraceae bacterium]
MKLSTLVCFLWLTFFALTRAAETAEIKDPAISGGVADGKVRLVIEGLLSGQAADKDKLIFSTSLQHWIKADRDKLTQHLEATFNILQGDAKELPLTITGEGDIKQITGEALQDWSVRQEANGTRTLLLRPKKSDKPLTQLAVVIIVERELKTWKNPLPTFALTPPQPVLFSGFVRVESVPELNVQPETPSGLFPVEVKYLPEAMRGELKPDEPEPLAFQFHGAAYTL